MAGTACQEESEHPCFRGRGCVSQAGCRGGGKGDQSPEGEAWTEGIRRHQRTEASRRLRQRRGAVCGGAPRHLLPPQPRLPPAAPDPASPCSRQLLPTPSPPPAPAPVPQPLLSPAAPVPPPGTGRGGGPGEEGWSRGKPASDSGFASPGQPRSETPAR